MEAFLAASRGADIATLHDRLAPDVARSVDTVLLASDVPTQICGAREIAEETRQFAQCAQAGGVLFVDGAPGIAIAPAGRLRELLRILVGNDDRIHAIDLIGDAGRLRTATVALPNPAAAAPRNTTAASTTKDVTGLTRAPDISGPAPGTGRGQERHVR